MFLDLDETLIHTVGNEQEADYVLNITGRTSKTKIRFNVRPFVKEFLRTVSKYYEIYIFTAATFHYANVICNFLDPANRFIKGIFDRNYCFQVKKGFNVKDLRIFKNRSLENVALVDNMPHSYAFQPNNGIPILSWFSNQKDTELKYLTEFLIDAAFKDDLTVHLKNYFKLEELVNYSEEELLKDLSFN